LIPEISYGAAQPVQLGSVSNSGAAANGDSGNGRVMLIDGTSVIHRAYYKLLGMRLCLCVLLFLLLLFMPCRMFWIMVCFYELNRTNHLKLINLFTIFSFYILRRLVAALRFRSINKGNCT
jgi:hypothetical protein